MATDFHRRGGRVSLNPGRPTPAAPTDGELVRRCRDGDEAAWRALVERYAALIHSVPRRHGLASDRADDVFADTCLALVRALPSIRDPKALPQWLIRTATRATWDVARKDRRTPPDLPEPPPGPQPDELASELERAQLVRDALAQLPDGCRTLIEQLYFTVPTPSYDEIARRLGKPRGSLGPTRSRCLEKLRELVGPWSGLFVSNGVKPPPEE